MKKKIKENDINNFVKFLNTKKEHVLKIQNEQKDILKEDNSSEQKHLKYRDNDVKQQNQSVSSQNNQQSQDMGMMSLIKDTNDAENVLLDSFLKSFNLDKITKQWLSFVGVVDTISKDRKHPKAPELFTDMLDYSIKFFGKINDQLNLNLKDLNNQHHDTTKEANKQLTNKYGFDTTPNGISEKILNDFESMCVINRVYSGSYLNILELIFEQNDIIVYLLKNPLDTGHINTLIGQLKNNLVKKNITTDKDAIKKFNEIEKIFDKNDRTSEYYLKAKQRLFELFETIKKSIDDFTSNLEDDIKKNKDLTEAELFKKMLEGVTEFEKQMNNNRDQINKLSKELKDLKNTFDKVLFKQQLILQRNYNNILQIQNKPSIKKIYDDNKKIFDASYQRFFEYIGGENASKIDKYLQLAKDLKGQYESKSEEIKQKNSKQSKETEDNGVGTLKISGNNKEITTINPVSVNNQ